MRVRERECVCVCEGGREKESVLEMCRSVCMRVCVCNCVGDVIVSDAVRVRRVEKSRIERRERNKRQVAVSGAIRVES